MSDKTSWAGVVRAYLNSATDAEADLNAKILADLFEEAADSETADMLRNKTLTAYALPPDEMINDSDETAEEYVGDCIIRFACPLLRMQYDFGWHHALRWTYGDDDPTLLFDRQMAIEYIQERCSEENW